MRNLYLVKSDHHTSGHHHLFRESAWIDNGDGTSLLSVKFHGDDEQEQFEELDGVEPLVKGQAVSDKHINHLAHLGVKKDHTTEDVHKLARVRYRAMK